MVEHVAFDPEGRIAVACKDEGLLVFDSRGERLLQTPLKVEKGEVTDVAFGPEGRIRSHTADGIVIDEVTDVAFGPEGRIVVGYRDGEHSGVMLFDASGKRIQSQPMEVHEGAVTRLAFIGPEDHIAAEYRDSDGHFGVVLFDVRGERLRFEMLNEKNLGWMLGDKYLEMNFSPDGRLNIIYERDGVPYFDTFGGSLSPKPLIEDIEIEGVCLAFGPEGSIAVGYTIKAKVSPSVAHGGVLVFDARGERVRQKPLDIKEGRVTGIAFGLEGRIAAAYSIDTGFGGDHGHGVAVFDAQGERLPQEFLEVKEGRVTNLAFIGPEGHIATEYQDSNGQGGVVLFGTQGGRLRPKSLENAILSASASTDPEGRIAVACTSEGVVVFDARGERLLPKPLKVQEGKVTDVAFGPRGRIAVGYQVGTGYGNTPHRSGGVVVFDARGARTRPKPIEVGEGWVTNVAFGPEGRIAVGFWDGEKGGVVLFDAQGKRVGPEPIANEKGSVENLAFGPDGRIATVYSNFEETRVVVFDADPASWRYKAAQVANRNFSWKEWTEFFPSTFEKDPPYRRTRRTLPWPNDLPDGVRKEAEEWESDHPEQARASCAAFQDPQPRRRFGFVRP